MKALIALLLLALGNVSEAKQAAMVSFTPPNGEFSCEISSNWIGFAEPGLRTSAAHILGPIQAQGAYRAAYHIHHFVKERPGFIALPDMLNSLRAKDAASNRQATPLATWRVAKKAARLFEVTENRMLPLERLPATLTGLHHYYAIIQLGQEEYFLIRLSTTEDSYLDYRDEFKRFLKSFRIVGVE